MDRSPLSWPAQSLRFAVRPVPLGLSVVLVLWLGVCAAAHAAQQTVRLRLTWGSGIAAHARWAGQIVIEGGLLTDLQPLGMAADAPLAVRIDGHQLLVTPRASRVFDGCDVTVQADEAALLRVMLQSDQAAEPTRLVMPVAKVLAEQVRRPLDELGSYFSAQRAPGDKLRVVSQRRHYVFDPAEMWRLQLQPDLAEELLAGPVELDLTIRAAGNEKALWQQQRLLTTADSQPLRLEWNIPTPAAEAAYRLTVTARRPESLANRLVPGRQAKVLAARELEFVVIDPQAKLPRWADRWEPVLTIDPANPGWWQRLPSWTRVPGLLDRTPTSSGNIRLAVRPAEQGALVELPAQAYPAEPYWQSYTLPVREPGRLHLVEIEYPVAQAQHLTISVIEPDAAGRVIAEQPEVGFFVAANANAAPGTTGKHRFVFWPRTRAPQLLLVNRQAAEVAQYGQIQLFRHAGTTEPEPGTTPPRLVAGYLAQPALAANFGAPEVLDQASGLSVHGWSTFLVAAQRLVQYLRMNGQQAVVLSAAADGSALYPSEILRPATRYDTGLLSSTGQDPTRKDVLEMLLRICDREGIRLIPAIQLATPLPRLEEQLQVGDARVSGLSWIGREGQPARQAEGTERTAEYNLLHPRVQAEVQAVVTELADRYGAHPALAGVALQLSGQGYGVLPGLEWGFDDTTMARFAADQDLSLETTGLQRFATRAAQLLGPQRQAWAAWRTEQLCLLYAELAASLQTRRADWQLYLSTEDLFAGAALRQRVRQSLARPASLQKILLDHGIDLARLHDTPGITALSSVRQNASLALQQTALDLRMNTASLRGELFASQHAPPPLLFQATRRLRLPSFDRRSPFGAEQTHVLLSGQAIPAGAAQRQHVVAHLARSDAAGMILGGETLSLATHTQLRPLLETLQQLPPPESVVRTQRQQPLVVRVYRQDQTTTVALINNSPWPLQVQLPLESPLSCPWQKLGPPASPQASPAAGETAEGLWEAGARPWRATLQAYDLQAWRFETAKLRVGKPLTELGEFARRDLQRWIGEIEARTKNLDIQRVYPQLQNPGFELLDGQRWVGWRPRLGSTGAVQLAAGRSHRGAQAAQLRSEDAQGVALQSHLFPLPETGQLVVSAVVRRQAWEPEAELQLAIEDSQGGQVHRQVVHWGGKQSARNHSQTTPGKSGGAERGQNEGVGGVHATWTRHELAVDDLPLNSAEQLRVSFRLTGTAEVLIDDVELCDLRFGEDLRRALVKRIYAAKLALEQDRVVDCLQVVNEYWSRYLVEYVPPLETAPVILAEQPATTKPQKKSAPGFKDRLKGWVPKIWR